jgi:hypothetical protein
MRYLRGLRGEKLAAARDHDQEAGRDEARRDR